MSLEQTLRLWRTVRHLKPVQIYGRFWFRLARPRPDLSAAAPLRLPSNRWLLPPARRSSMTAPRSFVLLNQLGALDDIGWDGPERDKLWRYNQHYFDDLNAEGAPERADWHASLIEDWITSNPPGQGTAWEPYPTSLRIVNWVKWTLAGNRLSETARHSLAVQARWLMRRLEHHLQGNHLFANAKALVFAGSLFTGPEAKRWRARGNAILARQIPEQILSDGGHFELSTMYHALAVEDLLDLTNLAQAFGHRRTDAPLDSMLHWLATMCHPDADIAFFNDAAFGVALPPEALLGYAHALGFARPIISDRVTWLGASGYARLCVSPATLLADLAPIGPDYLPGHAHADSLSFELSLFGQRIIVNSGTSVYADGPERLRQRGTAAHNTVIVCGGNSSEIWSSFRVGRRAHTDSVEVKELGRNQLFASGAHDGYRYLPKAPRHTRSWSLHGDKLIIEDNLTANAPAEAHYIFAPGTTLTRIGTSEGTLALQTGHACRWRSEGGVPRIEDTTWHPEFGVSMPTKRLVLPLSDGRSQLTLTWA